MLASANQQARIEARRAIHNAVRRGDVVPPASCEDCERDITAARHAHHDDYSKPLDVRWLCPRCHYGVHGQRSRNGKASEKLGRRVGVTPRYGEARKAALALFEQDYLESLLTESAGNITVAAELSGIQRATIYRMLGRHGLDAREFRP